MNEHETWSKGEQAARLTLLRWWHEKGTSNAELDAGIALFREAVLDSETMWQFCVEPGCQITVHGRQRDIELLMAYIAGARGGR